MSQPKIWHEKKKPKPGMPPVEPDEYLCRAQADTTVAVTWEVKYGKKTTQYVLESHCDLIYCMACEKWYNDPPGCPEHGGMH